MVGPAPLSPLQVRVISLGVCPSCHQKSLEAFLAPPGCRFYQCDSCLEVYEVPLRLNSRYFE